MSKKEKTALVPKYRFPEFAANGPVICEKGNLIFEQISNKNHNSDLPILAITQEYGAIPRDKIDYRISVTDKSLESYKVVEKGDFVISLRSFQGGIEYSVYHGICSPAYIVLRKKIDVVEQYYKYYFKSYGFIQDLNKDLEGIRDGKMVSYSQFSAILLPRPDKKEQQKIANCLSSLDGLIASEEKKLSTLRAHKNGLIQKLFPSEEKTVPEWRFPEFRNTKEWSNEKVSSLRSESLTNGVFNDPKNAGIGYKIINVKDMYTDSTIDENNLTLIGLSKDMFLANKVENGDVFFTRSSLVKEGIAQCNIYLGISDDITFDGHLIRFRPNKNVIHPLFSYFLFKTGYARKQLMIRGKTATMTTIGQSDIDSIIVPLPTLQEQQKIADCLLSIDDLITEYWKKINQLKQYKKGLIQGLFPPMEEVER